MTRLGPLLAVAVVAASGCDDNRAPRVPHAMVVSPARATAAEVGTTVPFRAQVLDEDGAIIYEADIRWSSSDERVATVSQRGLAEVTGQGSAEIRATHGRVSASGLLDVRFTPARLVKVTGDAQSAPALSRLPEDPAVRVEDRTGTAIRGVDVTFEVVSGEGVVEPRSAATDTSGVASVRWTLGSSQGEQRLRARLDTLAAQFTAFATEPELTIVTRELGRARATVPYREPIAILGIRDEPLVWSIVAGSPPLGIRLDSTGVLTGTPTGPERASFTVRVGDAAGRESSQALTLRVCPEPLRIQPGDVLVLTEDDFAPCPPALPAGSAGDLYRMAALRASTSGVYRRPIAFSAIELGAAGPVPAPPLAPRPRPSPAPFAPDPSALPPALAAGVRIAEATARHHATLFEDARRLMRRLGGPEPLADTRAQPTPGAQGAVRLETPSHRILLRPYSDSNDNCSPPGPSPVVALLVGYNDHLAIYQDSVQRLADSVRTRDARQVLDYYAAHGAATIDEYFGGVSDINGDGRVTVFVSPVVDDDVAAFVWPGDFLSRADCAASNERELVYFSERQFRALGPEQEVTHYLALSAMVHEVKHVSSLYRRTASGIHQPTWIEEGTAEIAAEVASRRAMAAAGGVARGAMLTRDAYPPRSGIITSPENYGMLVMLARTLLSYSANTNSLTGDPSPGHSYYGTSWHFHRFLGDAYGNAAQLADGDLFTALNDATTPAGTAGIESVIGKPTQMLIREYATAMMLNGTGAPPPERAFRTYDFPSATFELFRPGDQPEGRYPWPRTGPTPAPFRAATWVGTLVPAGVRFHDFESQGLGHGIEIELSAPPLPDLRVVFSRLR